MAILKCDTRALLFLFRELSGYILQLTSFFLQKTNSKTSTARRNFAECKRYF